MRSLALISLSLVASASGEVDVPLAEDFCQVYYHGSGDCTALASTVVANHSHTVPTLELGDPSRPAMLFFHGWPDDNAIWANQFEAFCGPDGDFFCVAPAWYNFHPQFPTLNASELLWVNQIDAFKALADEMGLKDITLVVHDFGAVLGYQFAYRYPELVKRLVAMDIGMDVTPNGTSPDDIPAPIDALMDYMQKNIQAYLADDVSIMAKSGVPLVAPCGKCKMFQARTGWPYYQFVRGGDDEFHKRLAPEVSTLDWQFSLTPSFPEDIPLLFIYGQCEFATGPPSWIPCIKRSFQYFSPEFEAWVNGRPGSAAVSVKADHWLQSRNPAATNAEMAKWLGTAAAVVA